MSNYFVEKNYDEENNTGEQILEYQSYSDEKTDI